MRFPVATAGVGPGNELALTNDASAPVTVPERTPFAKSSWEIGDGRAHASKNA